MLKLFVLSDDMTGALDTAVKFVDAGASTHVAVSPDSPPSACEADVLVMNANSRHLSPSEAYDVVFRATRRALSAGAQHFYKKVDSSLRGNIGAELSAMLEATEEKYLVFLPAFPQLGRITMKGHHWVNGILVHESEFGSDPFESVTDSYIPGIIAQQSDIPVTIASSGKSKPKGGIHVYDCASVKDLKRTVGQLFEDDDIRVMAGSAAFAETLPKHLGLNGKKRTVKIPPKRLLVLCGSVNPVARKQLAYAERFGFSVVSYEDATETSGNIDKVYRTVKAEWDKGNPLIVASSFDKLPRSQELSAARELVSRNFAALFARLLSDGTDAAFLITGGDTLLAALKHLGVQTMEPIHELMPGAVYAKAVLQGQTLNLITKAGGFGPESFFVDIQNCVYKGKD